MYNFVHNAISPIPDRFYKSILSVFLMELQMMYFFHPSLIFLVYAHAIKTENPNEQLNYKYTPRATKTSLHGEHTPVHWLSTPSCATRLGQEIWTLDASATEVSTIVVSSAEFAREVMKTRDVIFATKPQILASKIMSYDSSNIGFAPYGRITINLIDKVMSSINTITSRAAFGKKCKDHEKFISVVKEALKNAGGFNIEGVFPSAKRLHPFSGIRPKLEVHHQQADRIMENIINEYQEIKSTGKIDEDEGTDLIDVLLKYQNIGEDEFSLTINNIKAIILDIFGAGGETSAVTIDWAMSEMIKNPIVMKAAQHEVREVFDRDGKAEETGISEMKYLKLVVEETLRLHPPGPLLLPIQREQRCEIAGYNIPVKSKVIVNAWAIGRDTKYWTEPERFWPERFIDSSVDFKGTNFEYIPFGAGRRIWPGISYVKSFLKHNLELESKRT
ncbi:Cytochrome P450 [Quillaja saponaria]|uniref:Cytochrome P450 n=1 Tax=Quillaja saponaria TaxID=32244 RepID=A0AAD7LMK6_QUISA|nr:Cytochrome P450 [Quillaja saponaria]